MSSLFRTFAKEVASSASTMLLSSSNKLISSTVVRTCWTAEVCDKGDIVSLKHKSDDRLLQFPSVWLRDNCRCERCYDSATNSRLIAWTNVNTTVKPISHRVIEQNDDVSLFEVQWSDHHQSIFRLDWLMERSFNAKSQSEWLLDIYRCKRIPWNASEFNNIISEFSYNSLLTRDPELLKFLSNLDAYGIAIIKDAGDSRDLLSELINRIGFGKKTFYGDYYLVESKPNTTNLAYCSKALQLHLDLPYFEYCPGVNILHFVVQSDVKDEGVNQLVCGLNACNVLKKLYPKEYKTLTRVPVEWVDIGNDSGYQFHSMNHAPIICEDMFGEVVRINFNQAQRDSHFCVPLDDAIKWYEALKIFVDILHSPDNLISLKMKQGDMLAFDNRRLLHGRSAFNSDRCVLGMYMDWDIIRSKIRVLKSKMKK